MMFFSILKKKNIGKGILHSKSIFIHARGVCATSTALCLKLFLHTHTHTHLVYDLKFKNTSDLKQIFSRPKFCGMLRQHH